jgi:hypothetical protein
MQNQKYSTYFIADDVPKAKQLIGILETIDIKNENIGVVSKDPKINLAELPEVDLSEQSKLPEALLRGALLGSGTGLLAGVVIATFPVSGVVLGGAAVATMAAGGGAIGAWSAGMIGVSEQSSLIEKFNHALDDNKTVVFADLDEQQHQSVSAKIKQASIDTKIKSGNTSDK